MDYSRIARKLRERIAGFSRELSRGLPKLREDSQGRCSTGYRRASRWYWIEGRSFRVMAGHVLYSGYRIFTIMQ